MESLVDESGRSRRQGIDALLGEKDRVPGGFGEVLDTSSDVDGVTDEGEPELAATADGSGDYHTSVDPDADAKPPPNCSATRRWINTAAHTAAGITSHTRRAIGAQAASHPTDITNVKGTS